jgi:hypothetical protein
MVNRFKLEDVIYQSDMSHDLKSAFERHCDGDVMSRDAVDNMLMGLWQLAELRHWKLLDTFCREFELDQYCQDPEVLALRERVNIKDGKLKEDVE